MDFREYSTAILRNNGFKITKTRCCVLDVLAKSGSSLNAYEIAARAKKMKVKIDTSTVYRILEAYKKLGLVHFVKEQNGYLACKEFNCRNEKHCHHQFVCKKCKSVREIHFDDTDFIKSIKAKMPNFQIQNHYFEFLGQCAVCKK